MTVQAIVTGATGMIGRALCRHLLQEGWHVTSVVRPASPHLNSLKQEIAPFAQPEQLTIVEAALGSYIHILPTAQVQGDVFFHLAWESTEPDQRQYPTLQAKNIPFAIDAVQAASACGCTRFIGIGSQAETKYLNQTSLLSHSSLSDQREQPNSLSSKTLSSQLKQTSSSAPKTSPDQLEQPATAYGAAKQACRTLSYLQAHKMGLSHIWLRIFSVYGPHDHTQAMIPQAIEQLLDGEKPSFTPALQQWDYLYVDDAAQAIALAGLKGKDGAQYCLASGVSTLLVNYLEKLRDAVDPQLPLGIGELPYDPLQPSTLHADITPLQADTGFVPRVSFNEGIARTVAWHRSQRGSDQ